MQPQPLQQPQQPQGRPLAAVQMTAAAAAPPYASSCSSLPVSATGSFVTDAASASASLSVGPREWASFVRSSAHLQQQEFARLHSHPHDTTGQLISPFFTFSSQLPTCKFPALRLCLSFFVERDLTQMLAKAAHLAVCGQCNATDDPVAVKLQLEQQSSLEFSWSRLFLSLSVWQASGTASSRSIAIFASGSISRSPAEWRASLLEKDSARHVEQRSLKHKRASKT